MTRIVATSEERANRNFWKEMTLGCTVMLIVLALLVLMATLVREARAQQVDTVVSGSDTIAVYSHTVVSATVKVDSARLVKTPVLYPLGKPYGPFGILSSYTAFAPGLPDSFSLGIQSSGAYGIAQQLQAARAKNVRVLLGMTGGDHSQYTTNGKFDLAKWKAKQDSYCTTSVRASVDSGLTAGVLLGTELMDEPNHVSWGGVMTHPLLDSMSVYAKKCHPRLPTAVVIQWNWQKTDRYASVDFIVSQYSYANQGPILAYRDSAVASARRQGVGLAFSFNVLDGGTRPADYQRAMTDEAYWRSQCTYGIGTLRPNCRMSPAQIAEASKVFLDAPSVCFVAMWRYDSVYTLKAANLAEFRKAAVYARSRPAPPCKRPA